MSQAVTVDRKFPWNGLGTDVSETTSSQDLIETAGLDWEVAEAPVYAGIHPDYAPNLITPVGGGLHYFQVENRKAIVRSDNLVPLGVAGNYFEPIQNGEAVWLAEGLWNAGNLRPIRAGETHGGARTFLVGELSEKLNIGGIDPVACFFGLWNRHDGRGGLTAAVLHVRISCTNQLPGLAAAIGTGAVVRRRSAQSVFRWNLRHTTRVADRMKEVQAAINRVGQANKVFEGQATGLLMRAFTVDDMAAVAERLFPTEGTKIGARKRNANLVKKETLVAVYRHEDNLDDVRGTAWGGWNAVAEYADHHLAFKGTKISSKEESRFLSIVDPSGAAYDLKVKAYSAIAQTVGVGNVN